MSRVTCLKMALAAVLATPWVAAAQTNDAPAAAPLSAGQAAAPATNADTNHRVRIALHMQRINPTIPVGMVSTEAYLTPQDAEDLDQLRADLISLSDILVDVNPESVDRLSVGTFDEDRIQALTNEQLTVMYNILPDPVGFHMAVASLRESNRQAAARLMAAQAARKQAAESRRVVPAHGDAAQPDRLAPATSLDGTPLSSTISDPSFYTGGCPGYYYDAQAIAAFHATLNLLNIAVVIAKSLLDAATVEVFGAGNNVPFVVAWGILRVAQDANRFGLDIVEFCDGTVRDAYTDTTYDNLIAIYNNLNEHDTLEKAFLKEFRTFYIRKEVEKNLLQTGDLRISLFQLPETVMVQPESVGIATTQAIVLDTIQRNQLAGMPIGNATTLYNDGVNLLSQNKYKDAYARFRSAYQAAVNGTVR